MYDLFQLDCGCILCYSREESRSRYFYMCKAGLRENGMLFNV